jgi:hypothetical protein
MSDVTKWSEPVKVQLSVLGGYSEVSEVSKYSPSDTHSGENTAMRSPQCTAEYAVISTSTVLRTVLSRVRSAKYSENSAEDSDEYLLIGCGIYFSSSVRTL